MKKLPIDRDHRPRSNTETYEIAIAGLLTKRADTFGEIIRLNERLVALEGDLAAMDRVLGAFGYAGNLEAVPPRRQRDVPFKRGQVSRIVLDTLRKSREPLSTRDIAQASLAALGYDRDEDAPLDTIARRMSQALQRLRKDGAVDRSLDGVGNALWSLRV